MIQDLEIKIEKVICYIIKIVAIHYNIIII